MKNDIGTVFLAEFLRRIRSRIFLLATLGGAIGVAFFVEAPVLLTHVVRTNTDDIVIAGAPALRDRVATLLEAKKDFHVVARVESLPANVTTAYLDAQHAAAALAFTVRGGKLHVDVYPKDLAAFNDVEFRSLVPLNFALATGVPLDRAVASLTIAKSIHPLDAKFVDAGSASLGRGIATGLIFVLYIAIILASQSVMSAVAEEKTSRVAEILIATISPIDLMTGKTLAAAVLAIGQLIVWAATAVALLPSASVMLEGDGHHGAAAAANGAAASNLLLAVTPGELAAFAMFFVLGYLQYATVYAAAASLVSRTEDLGSVTTPMIMPVVGAFFIAQFALLQPSAPFVVACSFVPFVSPFVMFTRVAISIVPWWQVALAGLMNLVLVAVCFYLSGKVYRVGMLLYGKPPSPKQIWAVLKA